MKNKKHIQEKIRENLIRIRYLNEFINQISKYPVHVHTKVRVNREIQQAELENLYYQEALNEI